MLKSLSLVIGLAVSATCLHAAEGEPKPDKSEVRPEMQAWMEQMKPGPEHQQLAKLAGAWEVASKWFVDPTKPPEVSQDTASFSVIIDGRFLRQDFSGRLMGQRFTGVGIDGYDPIVKKYTSFWIDSLSNSMLKLDGTSTDGGKTVEYTGDMPLLEAGGVVKARWVRRTVSDDQFTIEQFVAPDGKEMQVGELTYTRKK